MLYTVYYIEKHPKDGQPYVGCTNDIERRMSSWYSSHNVPLSEVEILWETPWIEDASIMEQDLQKRILGKADGRFYHKCHSEEQRLARNKAVSEAISGENHPFYGKSHSEETKAKMSGKVSLNNGITNARVRPELVDEYLSQGYTYGWIRRRS